MGKDLAMKTTVLVARALGAALLAAPVAAATPEKYSFIATSASAYFYGDVGECRYTELGISAFDDLSKKAPSPSMAYVDVFRLYDSCTETWLFQGSGYAELASTGFTVDLKGGTAHLAAEVPVHDEDSGTTVTLRINMSWSTKLPLTRTHSVFHTRSPDYSLASKSTRACAEATAAGTVTDGQTNYTPFPDEFKEIRERGNMDIYHYK
jgi:hypothetical protein